MKRHIAMMHPMTVEHEDASVGPIHYDVCRRGDIRFYRVHAPHTIWNLRNYLRKRMTRAQKMRKANAQRAQMRKAEAEQTPVAPVEYPVERKGWMGRMLDKVRGKA